MQNLVYIDGSILSLWNVALVNTVATKNKTKSARPAAPDFFPPLNFAVFITPGQYNGFASDGPGPVV